MTEELAPRYEHQNHEKQLYKLWEDSGYFNPDKLPAKKGSKPFTIIMPPPNANGPLHIGHALFVTLEDIMIRYQRMRGRKALWLPGADHAGFETQVVYDKKLEKEGRNRFEMLKTEAGRKQLHDEIYAFTQENKKVMEGQLRKLGASCDWSRERFTLEPKLIDEVYKTFERLYKDGLVYRDLRVVNWCPKHQTALSDLEVKYEERIDPLYYIKYGPLTLATVRPETKFGDTGLAVNPKDKRYKQYIGKEIEAEGLLGKLKFKVIADEAVDPDFGTGVVKVTPAHDPMDFEIWQRHKDEIPGVKQVIDERGRLTQLTGPYAGLKVMEARQKVAEDMQKVGILEKIDQTYKHQVATCYKCGNTLEPLPKPQWFVAMTKKPKSGGFSLRDAAVKSVKSKKIKFVTKKFEKVFYNWMANIRDWNISRQIVWGIRIPVWYRGDEIHVGKQAPNGSGWVQDHDVFDTWFSSGQWPFAALKAGDTSNFKHQTSNDFKEFYPTQVMETGYDILFFWVARMMMLGLYMTGKLPFETIYLHGLVRDKDRQKMSKSKGNVIDPLGVAAEYGTDAVRMALVIGNAAGNDPIVSEDKIRGYRNFATKIWNASRFVLMNYNPPTGGSVKPKFTAEDKKNLKELAAIQKKVTKHLDAYDFNNAGSVIYHYFWHTFADKIIEASKARLIGSNASPVGFARKATAEGLRLREADRVAAQETLLMILTNTLVLLHPFMPFVTEAVYQKLPIENKGLLLVHPW